MTRPQTRHLLAVLACLLVVCTAIVAPAAAAETLESGDLDGTLGSDDDTTKDTSTDGTASDDDSTSDDSSSKDTSGESEKNDDAGTEENEADGDDDGEVEKGTGGVGSGADSNEDDSQESVGVTQETVDETLESLELVVYPGETRLKQPSVGAPGVVETVDDSLGDPVGDSPARVGSPAAVSESSDQSDGDDQTASGIPLSGSGGQPVPPESAGAAIGLGALAAAAVIRATPVFGSVGVPVVSSVGSAALPSLLDRLRPFLFPLRYSRYDDSDPLEHEARERVYEIVNDTPGSYLSEVSERAGLPLSTTRHHIKVLEREDLVSGAKLRGKRRFYPAYAEGIELAAALNDDSTANIIDAIARLGAASVSDLAEELGRDPSTISHHLQRLDEDDIIARERDGRSVLNKLSTEARTALEPDATPKPGEASEALAGGAD